MASPAQQLAARTAVPVWSVVWSGTQVLCLGIPLVVIGSRHQDDACDVSMAPAAITLGALDLSMLMLACVGVAISCVFGGRNAPRVIQAIERNPLLAILTAIVGCGVASMSFVLGLARLAILIWATVVAFGDSRLSKYNDNSPDFNCNRDLYGAFYVIVIVEWMVLLIGCCQSPVVYYRQQQQLARMNASALDGGDALRVAAIGSTAVQRAADNARNSDRVPDDMHYQARDQAHGQGQQEAAHSDDRHPTDDDASDASSVAEAEATHEHAEEPAAPAVAKNAAAPTATPAAAPASASAPAAAAEPADAKHVAVAVDAGSSSSHEGDDVKLTAAASAGPADAHLSLGVSNAL